ncbi:hypothetical protein BS333_05570 [Vibrio azureus]|uniref:DUF4377 domain-containing protein n=1 Tax=Vibrio azureus NBRC 104587 TaxID=1219077 RepID=U3ATK7_9VIBR|nr:hypothetical protein [Vibrio azureus]AUI85889.1 hypothetical protein BS333_05570 [Vibrio azureus]GAD77095.1 hypothetical protein VAZ01S_061_00050 [Vibrio azureus NBRC 104587]
MKVKSISLASLLLVASTTSFASYIAILEDPKQSTYHFSKYCSEELHQLKAQSPDAWIGLTEYVELSHGAYSFNYRVYHAPNYFDTEELAVIRLDATPVPPPVPADASSYTYHCSTDMS